MAEELEVKIRAAHRRGLEEEAEGYKEPLDLARLGCKENRPDEGDPPCNKELVTPQTSE